jgi:Cu-Zn family superoxide dismutase
MSDLKYKVKYKELYNKNNIAIACFNSNSESEFKINGTVKFTKENKKIRIDINLSGLTPNHNHGFHVHEAGDLSEKCKSACAHFNPYNKKHGCINSKERHVGDIGNIITDKNGNVSISITDKLIKLRGNKANIIGRSVVIHADKDDCGLGGFPDSLTTGHSGKRIACSVIGYSKMMFQNR